jgi:hypothetical protein
MKNFRQWIVEDGAPTNSAGSGAIRGLGYVTGIPNGDVSNYAAANAADAAKITSTMNTVDSALNYSGGDTEDQVLRVGRRRKR